MEHSAHLAHQVGGIIVLLVIAAATRALTKKIKLPFTITLVFIGIILALLSDSGPSIFHGFSQFSLTPELIIYVFLPTLIFESAFNLDAKQLSRNILPVITLAVPGLLLSTAIIGGIVALVTPFGLPEALLLGAILSATDPVAVIALFKQLGAPKRLTVLVEGESLFNDATSLVLARLLTGIVVGGVVSGPVIFSGVVNFFFVFFGGIIIGWLLAYLTGSLLGWVKNDSFIEITLTTILAYASFIIAEELFHVSGIMATVAAGITIGGWGRAKISPSSFSYMHHFWEYLAFLANALIFLMVGLQVNLINLWNSIDLLAWVLIAMLFSRALVIFGLVPLVNRLPGTDLVDRNYQKVMYWGGLRGAIALAIVLALPEFEHSETFTAIVMGAVLFTLIVQGLSIEKLVKYLGLDKPSLPEKISKAEGLKEARNHALSNIPDLQAGGLFSGRVAENLKSKCQKEIDELNQLISELHDKLTGEQEKQLLFLRCLANQKNTYFHLFSQGHLNEWVFRELDAHATSLISSVKAHSSQIEEKLQNLGEKSTTHYQRFIDVLNKLPLLKQFTDNIRMNRMVKDYFVAWGQHQANNAVINYLSKLNDDPQSQSPYVAFTLKLWQQWQKKITKQLDETAELFPEFVNAMQERLAQQLILLEESESLEQAALSGSLPEGIAEEMIATHRQQLYQNAFNLNKTLNLDPSELLRKVPFFQETPEQEFERISFLLKAHIIPRNETIIRQDEPGHSMFLIARGVVRVIRNEDGVDYELNTLMAGDFFGEMALLLSMPRSATVRAVTPCSLYELNREDVNAICKIYPNVKLALDKAAAERLASLDKL